MSYAPEQNIDTFKFTTNSLESIPKQRQLSKARLYKHPHHRNKNNNNSVQKTPGEEVLHRGIVLHIGFNSLTKRRERTKTSPTASIEKQLFMLSSH